MKNIVPGHNGIRIEAIREKSDRSVLRVTVTKDQINRIECIEIDSATAENLRDVCSRQPFRWRRGQEYSYWIIKYL